MKMIVDFQDFALVGKENAKERKAISCPNIVVKLVENVVEVSKLSLSRFSA